PPTSLASAIQAAPMRTKGQQQAIASPHPPIPSGAAPRDDEGPKEHKLRPPLTRQAAHPASPPGVHRNSPLGPRSPPPPAPAAAPRGSHIDPTPLLSNELLCSPQRPGSDPPA